MRWSVVAHARTDLPAVDAFLAEIWAVCERHKLALSHEDTHGGFVVVPLPAGDKQWLFDATYDSSDLVVCVVGDTDLKIGKIYKTVSDPDAARDNLLRVIDDSDEDYLYPKTYFAPYELLNGGS